MRTVLRSGGLILMAVGVFLALWGPLTYEFVTGYPLPEPDVGQVAAMSAWSGVAFLRVCGALLTVVGALVWAVEQPESSELTQHRALAASLLFAAAITWSQVRAIWLSDVGYFAVLVLLALAAASGWQTRQESRA